MLTLARSTRARTCHTCGGTIPKDTVHIEARGGPAVGYSGIRNNWVHFHHINCTRRACSVSEITAYHRRVRQERRQIARPPSRRRSLKRPWRV